MPTQKTLLKTLPKGSWIMYEANNSLLMRLIERGRIIDSNIRSININPYLLKFFKKRFNRPVI